MYPDVSYILHDLLGTEVDNWSSIFKTFGIFLALTFVFSFYVVRSELRRRHKEGIIPALKVKIASSSPLKDGLINAIFGFIIGFKVPAIVSNFESFKEDPGSFIFSMQGHWLLGFAGAILFGIYSYMMANNRPPTKGGELAINPADKTGDIIILAAISGVIGSRLFSILENLDAFWADPWGQLLSGSGLTIYGGLILATFCVYQYIKRLGIPPRQMMDIAAIAVAGGYGVGRMGCQFSGDGDWGIANEAPKPDWFIFPDWVWTYDYPRNVADFHQRGAKIVGCEGNFCTHLDPPVYPTPIYEITIAIVLFLFLWSIRKKVKVAGRIFFLYLMLSSFARFWVESIRVNPRYDYFGLGWSQAQWISAILFVVGIIGLLVLRNKSNSGGGKPDYTIPDMTTTPEGLQT